MVAATSDRPALALSVEKMWTGNRAETMAGIDGQAGGDGRGAPFIPRARTRFTPAATAA
jgi:hypothetical protein